LPLFNAGTPFALRESVNLRITYKGLSLLLGIFVALIVAFYLWVSLVESPDLGESIPSIPMRSIPLGKTIYSKVVAAMQILTLPTIP